MRHALDDMEARQECMDIMREIFRQFMSVLIQEKSRVEEEHIYLDPRISFQENPAISYNELATAIGINSSAIQKLIKRMKESGYIDHHDDGTWRVLASSIN